MADLKIDIIGVFDDELAVERLSTEIVELREERQDSSRKKRPSAANAGTDRLP